MNGLNAIKTHAPCLLDCPRAFKGAVDAIAFEINKVDAERAHVKLMKAENAAVRAAAIRADKAAKAFESECTPERGRALSVAVSELLGEIRRLEMPTEE